MNTPISTPSLTLAWGEGDECLDGFAVFSSVAPGFNHVDQDLPEESLFRIDDGVTITIEVLVIDSGLALQSGSGRADAACETLVLGEIPDLVHGHVEYLVVVSGGTEDWNRSVTLRLTTDSVLYPPSAPRTLTFHPEQHDGEHEDDEPHH